MHSRTEVDRDNRLVRTRRVAFRIEHMIFSDLLPVFSSCFDLSEVGDESGCNRLSLHISRHLLIPVSMHVEGTSAVAGNKVDQPEVGLQVVMIFNWFPHE